MSKKPNNAAAAFLRGMTNNPETNKATPSPDFKVVSEAPALRSEPTPAAKPPVGKRPPSREDKRHLGAYLDEATLEKVALLRIRLRLDNSELVKLAIEELDRKHNAKRAFGDA